MPKSVMPYIIEDTLEEIQRVLLPPIPHTSGGNTVMIVDYDRAGFFGVFTLWPPIYAQLKERQEKGKDYVQGEMDGSNCKAFLHPNFDPPYHPFYFSREVTQDGWFEASRQEVRCYFGVPVNGKLKTFGLYYLHNDPSRWMLLISDNAARDARIQPVKVINSEQFKFVGSQRPKAPPKQIPAAQIRTVLENHFKMHPQMAKITQSLFRDNNSVHPNSHILSLFSIRMKNTDGKPDEKHFPNEPTFNNTLDYLANNIDTVLENPVLASVSLLKESIPFTQAAKLLTKSPLYERIADELCKILDIDIEINANEIDQKLKNIQLTTQNTIQFAVTISGKDTLFDAPIQEIFPSGEPDLDNPQIKKRLLTWASSSLLRQHHKFLLDDSRLGQNYHQCRARITNWILIDAKLGTTENYQLQQLALFERLSVEQRNDINAEVLKELLDPESLLHKNMVYATEQSANNQAINVLLLLAERKALLEPAQIWEMINNPLIQSLDMHLLKQLSNEEINLLCNIDSLPYKILLNQKDNLSWNFVQFAFFCEREKIDIPTTDLSIFAKSITSAPTIQEISKIQGQITDFDGLRQAPSADTQNDKQISPWYDEKDRADFFSAYINLKDDNKASNDQIVTFFSDIFSPPSSISVSNFNNLYSRCTEFKAPFTPLTMPRAEVEILAARFKENLDDKPEGLSKTLTELSNFHNLIAQAEERDNPRDLKVGDNSKWYQKTERHLFFNLFVNTPEHAEKGEQIIRFFANNFSPGEEKLDLKELVELNKYFQIHKVPFDYLQKPLEDIKALIQLQQKKELTHLRRHGELLSHLDSNEAKKYFDLLIPVKNIAFAQALDGLEELRKKNTYNKDQLQSLVKAAFSASTNVDTQISIPQQYVDIKNSESLRKNFALTEQNSKPEPYRVIKQRFDNFVDFHLRLEYARRLKVLGMSPEKVSLVFKRDINAGRRFLNAIYRIERQSQKIHDYLQAEAKKNPNDLVLKEKIKNFEEKEANYRKDIYDILHDHLTNPNKKEAESLNDKLAKTSKPILTVLGPARRPILQKFTQVITNIVSMTLTLGLANIYHYHKTGDFLINSSPKSQEIFKKSHKKLQELFSKEELENKEIPPSHSPSRH